MDRTSADCARPSFRHPKTDWLIKEVWTEKYQIEQQIFSLKTCHRMQIFLSDKNVDLSVYICVLIQLTNFSLKIFLVEIVPYFQWIFGSKLSDCFTNFAEIFPSDCLYSAVNKIHSPVWHVHASSPPSASQPACPDYSCYQPVHRCVLFQGSKGCLDVRGKGRVTSFWHDIWKCPAQLDSHGPPGTAESRVPQVSHQPERGRSACPIRFPQVTSALASADEQYRYTHIKLFIHSVANSHHSYR